MKPKGLILFSGGLDSMLSAKVLEGAEADMTAITFVSAFFNEEKAKKAAKTIGINLIVINITEDHLEIVKNPPSGWGKNLNPCIDCHSLMFSVANKIAKKEGFDFIATGEVLGQRPFSQNKQAFLRIDKITKLKNQILRPLSAKLLEETEIEKSGKINREKLLDISGRSRKRQFKLAEKLGIKEFETPSGGCILTDPGYSEKGKKLLEINPKATAQDFRILRYGRFSNFKNAIVIIGRNKDENENLKKLSQKNDFLVQLKDIPGPSVLVRIFDQNKRNKEDILEFAKSKAKEFTPKAKNLASVEYIAKKIS